MCCPSLSCRGYKKIIREKPHAKGQVQEETCSNMYSILGHLHDSPAVQELLKSDPDALKTTHPIRLSIKEPLPSQDDKPLYGIVWNALNVVISVRQAIRIT